MTEIACRLMTKVFETGVVKSSGYVLSYTEAYLHKDILDMGVRLDGMLRWVECIPKAFA